jgi:hypothetical protein
MRNKRASSRIIRANLHRKASREPAGEIDVELERPAPRRTTASPLHTPNRTLRIDAARQRRRERVRPADRRRTNRQHVPEQHRPPKTKLRTNESATDSFLTSPHRIGAIYETVARGELIEEGECGGHLRPRRTARRVGADRAGACPLSSPPLLERKTSGGVGAGISGGRRSLAASDSAGGEALFKSAPAPLPPLRRKPQSLPGGWARGSGQVGRTNPRRRGEGGNLAPRTRGAPCFAGSRLGVTRIARRRARAVRGAHPTVGLGPGQPGTTTGDIVLLGSPVFSRETIGFAKEIAA